MFGLNRLLFIPFKVGRSVGCSKTQVVKYFVFSLTSLGLFKATMANNAPPNTIFNFEVKDIDGSPVQLSKYEGYVTLIVNVASQ